VYFILLTTREGTERVVEGLSAGADEFLTKPFNADELAVRLRTAERVLSLETRDIAIFAMARLAESRDPETGAHLERVRSYSRLLAHQLATQAASRGQVTGEFVRLIYLTSPLHDIGKVGIPDSVLLKPGRLSDREFEIMKTHTTIGAETLGAAAQQFPGVSFLEMARDIALTHHERFDGSGYPRGLRGTEIPLSGRIVALADVYDALTSKRVYKKSFAHDVARNIILAEAGKHFDPALVDAFAATEDEFIAVRDRFAEAELAAV
jgi:putative two-component system response regulator